MVPHKLCKMTILVNMPMLIRDILQVLLLDEKLKVINDGNHFSLGMRFLIDFLVNPKHMYM